MVGGDYYYYFKWFLVYKEYIKIIEFGLISFSFCPHTVWLALFYRIQSCKFEFYAVLWFKITLVCPPSAAPGNWCLLSLFDASERLPLGSTCPFNNTTGTIHDLVCTTRRSDGSSQSYPLIIKFRGWLICCWTTTLEDLSRADYSTRKGEQAGVVEGCRRRRTSERRIVRKTDGCEWETRPGIVKYEDWAHLLGCSLSFFFFFFGSWYEFVYHSWCNYKCVDSYRKLSNK